MIRKIINFYSISSPNLEKKSKHSLRYFQLSTFIAATLGYGFYYVCRLSLNVMKKPMIEEGIFSEVEIGTIGSVLFFTYAIGKFTNGFMADRSNVKRFISTGLLVTAVINLLLGFIHSFWLFVFLWGVSGWFQSMGAASCVVSLSRWFPDKERGSFYGFWSASHNIGEALTFILIGSIVGFLGWRSGFIGAGIIGLVGVLILYLCFYDSPESQGYSGINEDNLTKGNRAQQFNKAQKAAIKNPAIWVLALSSAFMYISRYAINSWGIFYLEAQKGYSTINASFIISVSSILGIVGTCFSGLISDRFFKGNRYIPAFIFGVMNIFALCLFLLCKEECIYIDLISMVLFGLSIGVLICFLGGLMAVDIAPKNASGAALGIVGISSYIGAGLQDFISGLLIESNKSIVNGLEVYDFSFINIFWIGSAILSVLLLILVRKIQQKK